MRGSEQNATSSLLDANQVACSRSRKDAILADEKLLYTVRSTDFGDVLGNFRVPVTAITANDKI
jgi:hypothetical protein